MKLNLTAGPDCDEFAVADLRRRLLGRISDLEAQRMLMRYLTPSIAELLDAASPADLMPPLSFAELAELEDAVGRVPLDKLD